MSADDTSYLDTEVLGGQNLYAYCLNNPVMRIDPDGTAPKWWQTILIGIGIAVVSALVVAAIFGTGGTAVSFLSVLGSVLKVATVTGVTAGIVRAGKMAIEGESLNMIGKSFVTGFADGFFAGSIYSSVTMLATAVGFRILSKTSFGNNKAGYGWQQLNKGIVVRQGLYITENIPGFSVIANQFGPNHGRSFSIDLDISHGLHYHSNKYLFRKKSGKPIKIHHWLVLPVIIGIGVGISDAWSEW